MDFVLGRGFNPFQSALSKKICIDFDRLIDCWFSMMFTTNLSKEVHRNALHLCIGLPSDSLWIYWNWLLSRYVHLKSSIMAAAGMFMMASSLATPLSLSPDEQKIHLSWVSPISFASYPFAMQYCIVFQCISFNVYYFILFFIFHGLWRHILNSFDPLELFLHVVLTISKCRDGGGLRSFTETGVALLRSWQCQ